MNVCNQSRRLASRVEGTTGVSMEGTLAFGQRRECEDGFTEEVEFINNDISR